MEVGRTGSELGFDPTLTTPSAASLADASKELDRDAFLKLLTTQIQNQDPLNPQQNHEFIAQLAQFSALEQQMASNKTLDSLLASQDSMANNNLSSLIGKEVVSFGDSIAIDKGVTQPISLQLAADAKEVNVTIRNAAGQAVDTVALTNVQSGFRSFPWDGLDSKGKVLPDGRYTVSVEAVGANDTPITVKTMTRGTVTGLTFETGVPELVVGAARIRPGEVVSISQPAPTIPKPAPNSQSAFANPNRFTSGTTGPSGDPALHYGSFDLTF